MSRMLPENLYILLGVPCSGKTTLAKLLREKHAMQYFSGDAVHFSYYEKANPVDHPAMSKKVTDYFDWTADALMARERAIFAEQTPMLMDDLAALCEDHGRVLFDGIMDVGILAPNIRRDRVLYLDVSRAIRDRDFFERPDHIHMLDNIRENPSLTDAEKERRIALRKTVAIDSYDYDVSAYGIARFMRDDNTRPEEMLAFAERHFGLV